MLGRFRILPLAFLAAVCAVPGPAAATNYFINFTKTATGLQFHSNWPATGYDPNEFQPYPLGSSDAADQQMYYGPAYGGLGLLSAEDGGFVYSSIIWRRSTGSLFNVLTFLPSGNRGNVVLGLTLNVTSPSSVNLNGYYDALNQSCYVRGVNGYTTCPVLNNGQTLTTELRNAYSGEVLGPLNITFNDGGSAPEPATWALMIVGFSAIGAVLRGRRQVGKAAGRWADRISRA